MATQEKSHEQLIKQTKQRVWKTVKDYRLIDDGDKILIGLSGGKDSLALVEILGERMKIYKPKFQVVAAHISVENIPYQSDIKYLQAYCEKFGIPFIHCTTSFDESTDKRKTHCFLCSWCRRKMLFEIAKANNCNKIALGHHLDDLVETMLMNITFQGAFGSMPTMLEMDKFDIKIIRPLAQTPEKEMTVFAKIRHFKKQKKTCPYEQKSTRADIKKIVKQLEKINPEFKQSAWNAMQNIQEKYLPKKI